MIGAHGPGILDAAISWAKASARVGCQGTILVSDQDRVAGLNEHLQRAGLRAIATQHLPVALGEPVLALVRRPSRRGPPLATQLARAPDLTVLVDRDTTPTDADLVAHLALDLPPSAAITQGIAAWQLPIGSVLRPADPTLPRFAIDGAGTPIVDPAAIRDSIAFWASAPFDLKWTGDFWLAHADVLAALSPEATQPAAHRSAPISSYSVVVEGATAPPEPGTFEEAFAPSDHVSPDELPGPGGADRQDDVGPDGSPNCQ